MNLTKKSKENYAKLLDDPNYLQKYNLVKQIVSPNIETIKRMIPVIPKYNFTKFSIQKSDFDLSLVPELRDYPNLIKYFQGYQIGNLASNLKIYYSSDSPGEIPKIYLDIIAFFERYKPKSGRIYIYNYHSPRMIGTKYGFNITSGLTYKDIVVVSRNEELPRLLIHELIHFYEIIKPVDHPAETHNFCNISPADSFFEAKTEALAILYNILFFESKNFEKYLIDELLFSVYQTSKILEIAGFKDYNSFKSNCLSPMNYKIPYFSYLFLRSIFLFNLADFLRNPNRPNTRVSPIFIDLLNEYLNIPKNNYMGYNLIDYQ
jgi:hypothetical protein